MRLATDLGAPCDSPECPPPPASASEFFGQARTSVIEPSPPETAVRSADSPLFPAALAFVIGALIGGWLIYRFSERVERRRARHGAAAEFRSALEPVMVGFRQAEREDSVLPLASALRAEADRITARIDLLSPLISPDRAGRLAGRLEELQKLCDAALSRPADPGALAGIRWSLSRLLFNSYI